MIARRGKGYTGSIWENEVALSTGLTPKGKHRGQIGLIPYSAFKKMSGIKLKPGHWTEVDMVEIKRTPLGDQRFCRGERG